MSISEQPISIPTGTSLVTKDENLQSALLSPDFALTTTVDRTKFGITLNAPMPDGSQVLADKVTLEADLSLVKA